MRGHNGFNTVSNRFQNGFKTVSSLFKMEDIRIVPLE